MFGFASSDKPSVEVRTQKGFITVTIMVAKMASLAQISRNIVKENQFPTLMPKMPTKKTKVRDPFIFPQIDPENNYQSNPCLIGSASYYASSFDNQSTANQEIFNNVNSTMAVNYTNRQFLGTIVLVECQETGRTAKVRINDVGDFADCFCYNKNCFCYRVCDLSQKVFFDLAPKDWGKGTIHVRIYFPKNK